MSAPLLGALTPNLQVLRLHHNKLTSMIPLYACDQSGTNGLVHLQELWLTHNCLEADSSFVPSLRWSFYHCLVPHSSYICCLVNIDRALHLSSPLLAVLLVAPNPCTDGSTTATASSNSGTATMAMNGSSAESAGSGTSTASTNATRQAIASIGYRKLVLAALPSLTLLDPVVPAIRPSSSSAPDSASSSSAGTGRGATNHNVTQSLPQSQFRLQQSRLGHQLDPTSLRYLESSSFLSSSTSSIPVLIRIQAFMSLEPRSHR
jgi:hypothetical protein